MIFVILGTEDTVDHLRSQVPRKKVGTAADIFLYILNGIDLN